MICSSSQKQWKPVCLLIVINFALGLVNLLLKKVLNGGTNSLVIVTYRQSIAAIFLAPIAYFYERENKPEAHIICLLFFSSLLGVTLTQLLFLFGLQYTSATFACAFINMVPVYTFIMALPFGLENVYLKSKSGRAKVLGTSVCIGGALLLILYKGKPLINPQSQASIHSTNQASTRMRRSSANKSEKWVLGSVLLTAGSILWSSWFLIQAKISKRYPCQYSSTSILSFFGAIQSTILSLIITRNNAVWVLKGKFEILSIIYSGAVGSGLCYVGMSWCVKQKGAVFTAAFIPLIELFVAVFDFSILQEEIYLGSVLGSILVILGMYLLLWGKSKETEECAPKDSQTAQVGNQPVSQEVPITVTSRCP